MAAEASAGQADGKPEVEHEDDEHFRTKDSSCRGRENNRIILQPGHALNCHPSRRFPLGGEINEIEATSQLCSEREEQVVLTFS